MESWEEWNEMKWVPVPSLVIQLVTVAPNKKSSTRAGEQESTRNKRAIVSSSFSWRAKGMVRKVRTCGLVCLHVNTIFCCRPFLLVMFSWVNCLFTSWVVDVVLQPSAFPWVRVIRPSDRSRERTTLCSEVVFVVSSSFVFFFYNLFRLGKPIKKQTRSGQIFQVKWRLRKRFPLSPSN